MHHGSRLRRLLVAASFGGLVAEMLHTPAAAAPSREPAPLHGAGVGAISGQYIVVYREGAPRTSNTSAAAEAAAFTATAGAVVAGVPPNAPR